MTGLFLVTEGLVGCMNEVGVFLTPAYTVYLLEV